MSSTVSVNRRAGGERDDTLSNHWDVANPMVSLSDVDIIDATAATATISTAPTLALTCSSLLLTIGDMLSNATLLSLASLTCDVVIPNQLIMRACAKLSYYTTAYGPSIEFDTMLHWHVVSMLFSLLLCCAVLSVGVVLAGAKVLKRKVFLILLVQFILVWFVSYPGLLSWEIRALAEIAMVFVAAAAVARVTLTDMEINITAKHVIAVIVSMASIAVPVYGLNIAYVVASQGSDWVKVAVVLFGWPLLRELSYLLIRRTIKSIQLDRAHVGLHVIVVIQQVNPVIVIIVATIVAHVVAVVDVVVVVAVMCHSGVCWTRWSVFADNHPLWFSYCRCYCIQLFGRVLSASHYVPTRRLGSETHSTTSTPRDGVHE